ncbi:MAG: hypothetical protein ACTSO2_15450 [Promethearchaeota archaeon]
MSENEKNNNEEKSENEEENGNLSPALKRLITMRKKFEKEQKERKKREQQLSVVMDVDEVGIEGQPIEEKIDKLYKVEIETSATIQPKPHEKTKKRSKSSKGRRKSTKVGAKTKATVDKTKTEITIETGKELITPELHESLKEENIKLKSEIESLKHSLAENILKRKSIERLITELNVQIADLRMENTSLKNVLEEFKKQKSEESEKVKSIAEKIEEQKIFEKEIQKLRQQNDELKKRLSYFEAKLKNLEKEKQAMPSAYNEQFATTISSLIKNLNIRIEEQQKIIEELRKQQNLEIENQTN